MADIQPPTFGERDYKVDAFSPGTVDGPDATLFDAVRESQQFQSSTPNYMTLRSAWSYAPWGSSRLSTIESRIEPHWNSFITWAPLYPRTVWASGGFIEGSAPAFSAVPWFGPSLMPAQALGSYVFWQASGQLHFQILEVKARFKFYYLVLNAVMRNNPADNLKWSRSANFVRNPTLVSQGTLNAGQTLRLPFPTDAGGFEPGFGRINYIVPNLTWGQYRSIHNLPGSIP